MLFEHPETGLQLHVTRYDEIKRSVLCTGERTEVLASYKLLTDANQPAKPSTLDDCQRLLQVDVMTAKGLVRLVRVDGNT